MHAHIVLGHPEPKSYNAHLADAARRTLEQQGWTTTVSDLYQMDFDPCERAAHYAVPLDGSLFDVQAEQRHASAAGSVPAAVAAEIACLDRADLLILQYPMWWHLPPAMLKGWLDRVFIFGEVYTSKQRFEHGRFVGKRAMLSVTVGTSEETYAFDGRSGDIDLLLWPINFSLAYVGYSVLQPYVAYGVEAGLRYSAAAVVEARLKRIEEGLAATLTNLEQIEAIPFNTMADWGSDGRITAEAPVHSPFIRRKQNLVLE
jgi:NAD(P)H dehydrogenase (quinone)